MDINIATKSTTVPSGPAVRSAPTAPAAVLSRRELRRIVAELLG